MEQAAGIVLLLLAVALVIQLMRAGPDGVREWLRAKFLGQTAAGQRAAGRSSARGADSGGASVASTVAHSVVGEFTGYNPFDPSTWLRSLP